MGALNNERSITDICNQAFEAIKEPTVADIENGTHSMHARALKAYYRALRIVTGARPWERFEARRTLAALSSPSIGGTVQDKFTTYCVLPGDCARVNAVITPHTGFATRSVPADEGGGQWLGVNAVAPVKIDYTRLPSPPEMTDEFAGAVAARLAWILSPRQTDSEGKKRSREDDAREAYRVAALADSAEADNQDIRIPSNWHDRMRGITP